MTEIQLIEQGKNNIYIKREDLIPFSFGGNKARKAILFFNDYDNGDYDCIVTYGSSSSNHCRVIANICSQRKIPCYIISPQESSKNTFNSKLMELFGAKIVTVPVCDVKDTINEKIAYLEKMGRKPYFIQGGGHGNIGTQAYVNCFNEILEFEKNSKILFDYIFLASGTGTTQAGLICGKILNNTKHNIIGISIARKNPRGRDVVIQSCIDYFNEEKIDIIQKNTIFVDDYIANGYGKEDNEVSLTIDDSIKKYGIPLDPTYTGKAFNGMLNYIQKTNIIGKNILFIHTGGTPLFFDYLRR